MALAIARYLDMTATQGAADAFVETSVATNIEASAGEILKLSFVEVKFAPSSFSSLAQDFWVGWSLTRDTKAAIVNYSDPDCLMSDGIEVALVTSGYLLIPISHRFEPPDGIFIAEPTLYFQLDSTGTGNANVAFIRAHYTSVKATEVEILRLLNNN